MRQILWFACRYHIMELILKAAFIKLFWETTGPKETFFKFMKHAWTSLDLVTSFSRPQIPAIYHRDAPTVLSFVCSCLKPENDDVLLRDDYKEFLELTEYFLVETLTRRRESPRESSFLVLTVMLAGCYKAIYTLKLMLLQSQFPNIPWSRKKMSLFIICVYL